jgi:UPF0042 nucleotide-binding protein
VAPSEANAKPQLVLITGLSGSGKSTVGKCFEDLGYYCVDNLPLPLLRNFLAKPLVEGHRRIAVVTDVRAPGFASEFPRLFDEIDRDLVHPVLLFLEASDEVLVRRFSETRRPHPLGGQRPVIEGIRAERELMTEVRARADKLFDSSDWSIHEMRAHIYQDFGAESDRPPGLEVSLVSFGYKHGVPAGTDLLLDVRFLPNPYFVPGLRERTGELPRRPDRVSRGDRPLRRPAALPAAALRGRAAQLPVGGHRLHRRTTPLCGDRRAAAGPSGGGGLEGAIQPSRHRALA